jgi:hypothetical protein
MLIERLRQSGYVIEPGLFQPARRPHSLQVLWQRVRRIALLWGNVRRMSPNR